MGTPLGITARGPVHVREAKAAADWETAMPRSMWPTARARPRRTYPSTGDSSSAYMWKVATCAAAGVIHIA